MERWPCEPSEWRDYNKTLWREFDLLSTNDVETLKRLVEESIPDRGNSAYLRARLLGILNSKWDQANALFWTRHYHPKTYKIRLTYRKFCRRFHRFFKTKKFRTAVRMCEISRDCIDELIAEGKIEIKS